jgi:kynureninase
VTAKTQSDWPRADAEALDRADRLAGFRDRFVLPDGVIYLDGNSLGPLPRATPARIAAVVAGEWGVGLIRSWTDAGWIDAPARIGDRIAGLIGAPPGSVLVADSTSVNLFKLLAAALALQPGRNEIVTEDGNFPTDLYVAAGLAELLGQGHRVRRVATEDLPAALGPETAVLMLTHVNYRTGAMHDMAALTRAAHAAGALVLWDLAHSAGAVPVELTAADADMAVGCGYKFLNGGPGAPAFLYAAPRLHDSMRFPISGWLGHAEPFAFSPDYRPATGIGAAMVGTPPILSLAALEVGVELASAAPMDQVREKSLRLGELFRELVAETCGGHGLRLLTPEDPAKRGSQISFAHPGAEPITQALIARGVIGDVRAPDILRFGLTPLTLRFVEVWDAVAALREVLETEAWRAPVFQVRRKVT